MKLKYYLRGLGVGIIVTAVIMGVSGGSRPAEMTDAQIVARAKELGMVDGVLSQLEEPEKPEMEAEQEIAQQPQPEKEAEQETVQQPQPEKEAEQEAAQQPKPKETEAEQEAAQQESEAEKSEEVEAVKAPEPEVVKKIVVTIYPGEGSYTVSRKLAALGLVESADIYDKFLCQNGYDKKIITGNHEIEAGMTADEIARALTVR